MLTSHMWIWMPSWRHDIIDIVLFCHTRTAASDTNALQVFTDNPLTEFVDLPDEFRDLKYCNILCGVIRGALEMVR